MSRLTPKIVIGALLAIFFGISLIFRTVLPHDQIFVGDWIKFSSIDAYYHMRLVDNLVHNFPSLTSFDPFFIYPGGINVIGVHFFDWLLAGVVWVIGLGSPTQHTINVVGVYFPAILAALTVIPIYFIGKALFNRWAGVIAAALVAILPGEFMGRSILGFTDQHIAETLFSMVAVLFLILAIKAAGQKQLTFDALRKRDWKIITRPLVYSLLAGFFLGLYLITWIGGLLFVFIIVLYFIIQFVIDHLRGKSSDHLCFTGFILFLVALVIFLPFSPPRDISISMIIALFIPLLLSGMSWFFSRKGLKLFYYPLALVVIAAVFVGIFYAVTPPTFNAMLANFRMVFAPGGAMGATTLEMQPFLSPQGSFSTLVAWGNFTTNFFLIKPWPIPGFGIISFVILVWLFVRRRTDEQCWLLFLTWTLVIWVATLTQRRFAYYLAVNIALLSAYLSWQIIWLAGLKKLMVRTKEAAETPPADTARSKMKKRSKEGGGIPGYHMNIALTALAIVVVFFCVLYPNISKSKEVASSASFAPSNAWQESLLWMKDNTPEPFGDPDAYYSFYETPTRGEKYKYPESAYGVASWWDYGYWITRTAHRIPSANPSQPAKPIKQIAELFLSPEEPGNQGAMEIMEELESSYVVIDCATATSKFWAVVTWAERAHDIYTGVYYIPYQERLIAKEFYYPEYYHTLCVRLYNFDGEAVSKGKPTVITYDEVTGDDGQIYRVITQAEEFSSYQEALNYIEGQEKANQRIVSVNPFISPISFEALEDFQILHSSEYATVYQDLGILPEIRITRISVPEVKIFEYVGD
jgi:dolichyl-diphosphooligosaccharide--protein glycosyltransferase